MTGTTRRGYLSFTMTHTLTQRPASVNRRKKALKRLEVSYPTFAKIAKVSHSLVWKWVNGERNSERCDRAFAMLTNNGRS